MHKINKFVSVLTVLTVLINMAACQSSSIQNAKVSVIEYQKMDVKKALIEEKEPNALANFNQLIKQADNVLNGREYSVVNKKGVPPSGDKHDYMTIGPYWWPNPDSPDGLPYIRKDGEINPETRNDFTDFVELQAFSNAIHTLKDAFYFSEEEAYAKKAVELIDAWFLNADTKMNPNMDFGQSIPGKYDGRPFGIIEFERIIEVIKCLELLEDRSLLPDATKQGMNAWLGAYANWLQTSDNGTKEANTKNNHATHYDGQLLSIKLYLGEIDFIKEYLNTVTSQRIFSQIEPNGSQPLELARTKSFSYSVMNLHGFLYLARLGQKVGVDLWHRESPDGRSIKRGFEYMLPYLTQEKEWEYKQIADVSGPVAKLLADLRYAKAIFNENAFDEALLYVEKNEGKVLFK